MASRVARTPTHSDVGAKRSTPFSMVPGCFTVESPDSGVSLPFSLPSLIPEIQFGDITMWVTHTMLSLP